jgi:GNAT superfamily N-acetyltransferase
MGGPAVAILPFGADHHQWAADLLRQAWGSSLVVSRGRVHDALLLSGFVAVMDGRPVGLVTYRLAENECELVTINSLWPGAGIGSALLQAVREAAQKAGCRRLWLITTNDNLEALRFYQVKGFSLVAVHRNALDETRRLKPGIPRVGQHGIPLRDEVELEMVLGSRSEGVDSRPKGT